MSRIKLLSITIILLTFSSLACSSAQAAQQQSEDTAEVNGFVDGTIPSIKTAAEWTSINVTIEDAFGIDWDKLSASVPEWWMRLIWPFNPSFPQPVQRFLGYTSLQLEPEIIEGDSRGWFTRVYPTSITGTNPGMLHNITLDARIENSAVDYAVVIGIKVTRIDTLGGILGSTYIKIPVKASPLNFVEMRSSETSKTTGLKSLVYFTVDITNNGFYRDVFHFDLKEENGLMALFHEQVVVLNRGETKTVTLGVLTPEKFFDVGTPNKIEIYISSDGDPTKTHIGTLVVITQGMYLSPLVGLIAIPLIIIVLLIMLILFILRRRKKKTPETKSETQPVDTTQEKRRLIPRLFKKEKPVKPVPEPASQEKTLCSEQVIPPLVLPQEHQEAPEWEPVDVVEEKKAPQDDKKRKKLWQKIRRNQEKQRRKLK